MSAGHLIAHLKLLLGRDVHFDLLDRTVSRTLTGFDGTDLAFAISFELVKLSLERTDDLHDLDANGRRIDLNVL